MVEWRREALTLTYGQPEEEGQGSIGIGSATGGANPYFSYLRPRQAMHRWDPVTVRSPEDLEKDSPVVCV